ncbi:MAG: hypothetical protein IT381_31075 [Deltaproteobacteria bacterium]|nr:hypothetical protein [Deltaproteobacteria bacterium]
MAEPNIPLLIKCAKRLARSVGVRPAPDKDVRRVIDDTLYGRQILAAGRQALITREETGYVLVGHWLSELFMHGTFKGDDHAFVREVAAAILGPPKRRPVVKKKTPRARRPRARAR